MAASTGAENVNKAILPYLKRCRELHRTGHFNPAPTSGLYKKSLNTAIAIFGNNTHLHVPIK